MRTLKISREIALPIDAVTQTIAAIGRKGSGKTYLATMIAEQMLDAHAQVVVIDPVGNWWGLRVDADGRSKGKEIFVIGGEHGDVPLLPTAGKMVAKLVVEKNISAVIDVSGFRIGEHKRFAADFAEEFFHLKKSRKTPVHVFIEEAQKIIPQRVGPDEARMVGAFEQIVRLGRNYGIGCTLITQRPQSVNKEVLSQVECLCVLQVTGPHERTALEEWVSEAGADRKLVGELPGLARGEGYVWSPAWLRTYQRVHFSSKTTFDASATPEVGKATKAASISAVDVAQLRDDMQEVIVAAEQDDPKALKRRIAELEKRVGTPVQVDAMNEREVQGKIDAAVRSAVAAKDAELFEWQGEWLKTMETWFLMIKAIGDSMQEWKRANELKRRHKKGTRPPLTTGAIETIGQARTIVKNIKKHIPDGADAPMLVVPADLFLTSQEQRILNAIAWFNTIGISKPTKIQVGFIAEYRVGKKVGGAFGNLLGKLRSAGLIDYPSPGTVMLTDAGSALAEPPDIERTTAGLQRAVYEQLATAEQRVLAALVEEYPNGVTKLALATLSGYEVKDKVGGAYGNILGRLRSLGLITYPSQGVARAADLLFIE